MTVPRRKLKEVADFVNGKAFKPSDWSTEGVPIIRIQNLNGANKPFNYWAGPIERQVRVKTNDLLLAWSGTPGTSFGAHIWDGPDAVLNQHIFRVDLNESVITKSWAKFVINARLETLIGLAHGGVGLKHVTRAMVDDLEIPVPSMAVQRRMASILEQGDALRAKRRESLAQLDTLTQSIFVEMFGDPASNPKGWKRVLFGELLSGIDSGWSPTCLDRPVAGVEWGVLKLGAVTWCEYNDAENKALPPNVSPVPELEVKVGDLLFTRKNTYELVGACALVSSTRPRLLISDLIFRFRLRPSAKIDTCYLHQLLINPSKRREVQKLANGSSGSMPNISKGRLQTVEVEMPPSAMQSEFRSRVTRIEGLRAAQHASLAEFENLLASLQHRAFRGEL